MIKGKMKTYQMDKPEPVNDSAVFETVIPPLDRLRNFSPDDFEGFIAEWAISCKKVQYQDVYRLGGSGDKGRDVIGDYGDGRYDYYQCKRYEKKLSPSEYWVEFGKLVYFTYNEDIPIPEKYYVVASQGIGSKMSDLIDNPQKIRDNLIKNWNSKCKSKITKNKDIILDGELLEYINKFNFNIVKYYSIEKIVEEHRKTDYFYFRFGGMKKPERKTSLEVPRNVEEMEKEYIKRILEVYSEKMKRDINLENIVETNKLLEELNRHRACFYSAESLKRCIRDIFSKEDEFEKLEDEMHSGIIDFMELDFTNSYEKLKKTIHESTKVDLSVCKVDRELNFVCNNDKKGICHHLVNKERIDWRTSNECL